jgi:hypothetical protein
MRCNDPRATGLSPRQQGDNIPAISSPRNDEKDCGRKKLEMQEARHSELYPETRQIVFTSQAARSSFAVSRQTLRARKSTKGIELGA